MKRNDIIKFLEHLGASPSGGSRYVMASCVFAPWLHDGGTDVHPSFGISVRPGQQSKFHCYACGEFGTLLELVYRLRKFRKATSKGGPVNLMAAHSLAEKDTSDQIPDFESYEEASNTGAAKIVVYPEAWLKTFPKVRKHSYLRKRKILPWLAEELDLRFDPKHKRVCFPIRDFSGRLVGLHGRDVTGTKLLRHYAYPYKEMVNRQVWLGEDKVDMDMPVLLTEGSFDYARIYVAYGNVLASMGGLSITKLKRIRDANHVITFFDYGTGGNTARSKARSFFGSQILKEIIPPKELGDAGAYSMEAMEDLLKKVLTKL